MSNNTDFYIHLQGATVETVPDINKIINLIQDFSSQLPLFQVVDAKTLSGKEQVISACWHAYNHFKGNMKISSQLSIEVLLYLSGVRQISKALSTLGITTQTKELLVLAGSENPSKIEKVVKDFLIAIKATPKEFERKNQKDLSIVLEKTAETTLIIS